jgi:hypothetical protein
METSVGSPLEENKFICDGKYEITYYLAAAATQNRPIIFILHGHGYAQAPSAFRSENWNVVCPMDRFGVDGLGSWFLGEYGNFFWLKAIPVILDQVRQKTGQGRVHFWGSSMGGYAAILHGHRVGAKAVYANVPQTRLLGSSYSENGMKKYFEPIFGDAHESEFNDLTKVIIQRTRTKYFLCFNQLEGRGSYVTEQCFPFISQLQSLRQPYYLEIRPIDAHGKNHGVGEVIALFNKYGE